MMTKSYFLLVPTILATCVPAFAQISPASTAPYRCVDFGPYVGNDPATGQLLNPNTGPHPTPALIDSLLDVVAAQGYSCIQTYGFLNGLDYIIPAAKNRNLKVVAIAWLDWSQQTPTASFANVLNGPSIGKAIQMAKAYPETIVRLSCGSEYVSRNAAANRSLVPELENAIRFCLTEMRAQAVPQPLTSIDTWWEWCNASYPCRARALAANVDWIGINVFPWWENRFSGLPGFTCTTAANAGAFTLGRANDVFAVYQPLGFGKDKLAVTEFGWPRQPEGFRVSDQSRKFLSPPK